MTQNIPLDALPGRIQNTANSNQESDGTKRDAEQFLCWDCCLMKPKNEDEDTDQRGRVCSRGIKKYVYVSVFSAIVVIIPSIVFISKHTVMARALLVTQYCPDGWISFQDNCYYFSEQENDWNSSRNNCSTQHADLTAIDTKEEMDFLRKKKCNSDLWIGLEMTKNQTGQWVNGTMFNKWFNVRGSGNCAYLGDDGVATARCYTERRWICRRKKALAKNF